MNSFPPVPVKDDPNSWFCPAFRQVIPHGLCWECCFAGSVGPSDTTAHLCSWIDDSGRFDSLEDFHRVCALCEHCQWSREPGGDS
jgi:hypothetical protein